MYPRMGRGGQRELLYSLVGAVVVFFVFQFYFFFHDCSILDDHKITLQADIFSKQRRLEELRSVIDDRQRQLHRLDRRMAELEEKVRDRLSLGADRRHLPTIYFVTPTQYRPAQKADLIRLSQTLQGVPALFWLVVEDSDQPSASVQEIVRASKLPSVHICALTPPDKKLSEKDKVWKFHRGVVQRNAALTWLRRNVNGVSNGIVYFGDDDNTYDWRLFDEIRSVSRVGVWPVGIVGGKLAEAPLVGADGKVSGFEVAWQPNRPFPVDMAAFAVHLRLLTDHNDVLFTYNVSRGHQETHMLAGLGLTIADLEPKASNCSKVFVWHTRTERTKLWPVEHEKFISRRGLSAVDRDAIGV